MTETPDRLPDPPRMGASPATDPLLDAVRGMRLSGGIFLEAAFTAPWCVTARVGPEDCSPYLARPRNIIAYHYVSAGRLLLQVGEAPPIRVAAGDIIVLPRNDEHRLASGPGLRPVSADRLIQPAAQGSLARIVHGGGGEATRVLCGFLGSEAPADPIFDMLPVVMKLEAADGVYGEWVESSFRFAATELKAEGRQSPAMIAKLAELLFMEAVRRYLAALPSAHGGWLAGMRDPIVGRALALIHGRPAERWTTERLAREAGLSRSAFAERFARLMREPPMRYLARRRLESAAQRLRDSREPVARISYESGYESEPAFNRAFKRAFGVPPATWRRRNGG